MITMHRGRDNGAALLARQRIGTDYRGTAMEVLLPRGRVARSRPRSGGRWIMRSLFFLIALAAGLACGVFNLQTGDTTTTAILLAAASLVLALIQPGFAWMTASLVGLGVPMVYLWAEATSRPMPFPPSPNVAATLLALLPAVAAALLALMLRRVVLGPPQAGHRH